MVRNWYKQNQCLNLKPTVVIKPNILLYKAGERMVSRVSSYFPKGDTCISITKICEDVHKITISIKIDIETKHLEKVFGWESGPLPIGA